MARYSRHLHLLKLFTLYSLEVQQELVFSTKCFDHTAVVFFSGNTIQHIS